ncbi:MAG: hypothetical protein L3J71_13895 [Victivallaceae bacterium]|nr:hypothetical protein [Victivallaceae bacterium]
MSIFKKLSMFTGTIIISIILLFCISLTQSRINGIIEDKGLRFTGQIKNAPPIVAFTTVALGSFRGILADILWLRSAALQDEGNYFEMVQLATWVTELQPKFSGAAAYLAWNMAYNISVTCSSFADRWRWVQSGIKLLRDRAIAYNPNDPVLYKELGWIFQHKIGNVLDDANLYYKNQLAIEMTQVLGYETDWTAFANAPVDLDAFMKAYPKDSPLWKSLETAKIKDVDQLFAEFKKTEALPEAFIKALKYPNMEKDLISYFRARWLREKYRLDAVLINKINQKYGMLDWRLPEAQAIYWATKGLEMTRGGKDINCERMITQGLKDAFMSGRLLMIDKDKFETIITVPNLDVVDSVITTLDKAYIDNKTSSFRSAKLNFIKDAIVVMYNYGKFTKAKELYKSLRKEEPGKKAYLIPLETFVLKEWAEDIRDATTKKATDSISGLIYRSCYFLTYGDMDAALAQERIAKYIYKKYMLSNADTRDRTGLAPYSEIKKAVVKGCLKSYPPVVATIFKAKLEELKAIKEAQQKKSQKGDVNKK